MRDLGDLLRTASEDIQPSAPQPFAAVQARAHQRTGRRRVLAGSMTVMLVASVTAVAAVAASSGPPRRPADKPAVPRPCVKRDTVNAEDTFAAIPRNGIEHLTLMIGDRLTVGWLTCGETGDLTSSDPNDGKHEHLAEPGTGLRVKTVGVASARFQAFASGQVMLTGTGGQGSTGTLDIIIRQYVEPSGASHPSPYPGSISTDGLEDICVAADATDAAARVTRRLGVSQGGATLEPPGAATSQYTAQQTLDRHRARFGQGPSGSATTAFFGLFTDPSGSPFPVKQPSWVVANCGGSSLPSYRGGFNPNPPAPGSTAAPGGAFLLESIVVYDERGQVIINESSGYPDRALRSERLFEVPFRMPRTEGAGGRQVRVRYSTDDSCATFDHLDVVDGLQDGPVYVRIWLRLLPGRTTPCTKTDNPHEAVIGLRQPRGERPLIRGPEPR